MPSPATDPLPASRRPLPRLAIVLSHPVQYYSPWFSWLAKHTALPFRVFYLWDFGIRKQRDPGFGTDFEWDIDLLDGYPSEFVPNLSRDPGTHHFLGLNNPELPARLAAWRPDAVLFFGYNWLSHLRALAWARRQRLPCLFRGDSHLLGRKRPRVGAHLLLWALYHHFDAFLPVGAANRAYFRALGVPESQLFFAPHAVDARRFDPEDPAVVRAADRLRSELGLFGRRVVLFAGKLQARKQPYELLQAYLASANWNQALVFVGEGPEYESLKSVMRLRSPSLVRFLPFANQSEMPSRYALGHIFALPSIGFYETWGLAVNEAMHMGLPCLVSDMVGCQQDLVIPGKTGWVCHTESIIDLYAKMRVALRVPDEEIVRLGRQARAHVANYSYAATTVGLMRALAHLPRRRR